MKHLENILLNRQVLVRRIALLIFDVLAIILASGLSILLRFNLTYKEVEVEYAEMVWSFLPITIILTIIVFSIFKLYNSVWSFAGITEVRNIVSACFITTLLQAVLLYALGNNMFRSFHFLYFGIFTATTICSRFLYRLIRRLIRIRVRKENAQNTMIIGAGDAANLLIKELLNSECSNSVIKCVIDDNPNKLGKYIHGIKIVGNRDSIPFFAEKFDIDEIIIAIPSAKRVEIKNITNICKELKCNLKILPGVYQLVNGEVNVSKLRKVDVEDLLGREPIKVDIESIMGYVQDKVVLVTGGGGSIGSELCRQLAQHQPKQLIIFDIYENNAYDIKQELNRKFPDLDLVVLIGSVRNTNRINSVFEKYHPNIVYHAAAHKHVPLMEDSPNEAIKNNVFGTLKTVKAADKYGTERFVMISTDKAVNPTNIMGASKRICEMIIQTYNKKSKTDYVAVRFGNVLGSNGSVIPLFKNQIAAGGPVTVTHPDIIRYFMTIPEAVSLVLQAGTLAKGGEIFVLDMGEPVKILDLAKNLIRLSGYVPNEDIMIEFTGLRPGEKLFEELLMAEEGMQETDNKLIHIGKPIELDEEKLFQQLKALDKATKQETKEVRRMIKEIVPTYVIKEENN